MSKRNFRKRNEKNQKRAKARDDTNKDNDIEEIVRTDQVGRPQRSQHSSNITISGSSDALATYMEMMAPTLGEMYVFGANNGGPQFMAPPQRLPPPHQDIIAARGAKGGPKNHDKGKDKVNASKPAAATNADAVVLFRKNVPMSQARCPNCRLIGHWLVRCVGPPNIWGFIPGCPWCSDTGHRWQQCSEFPKDNWQEIARILLSVRKNLPPLEFTIAPTDLEHGKPGMKYAGCLPWTTQFATRFHMENPDYWKTHVYHLNQKDDTMIAVDNSWSAEDYPANLQMLVTIPWEGHPVQATRPGPKKRTRRSDDPEASKRQRTDGQPGTDVEVTNFGNTPAQPANPVTDLTRAIQGTNTAIGSVIEGGANVNTRSTSRGKTYTLGNVNAYGTSRSRGSDTVQSSSLPNAENQSKVIVSLATIAATSIDLLIVLQYAEAVAKQITIRTNARALMQSASAQSIPAI